MLVHLIPMYVYLSETGYYSTFRWKWAWNMVYGFIIARENICKILLNEVLKQFLSCLHPCPFIGSLIYCVHLFYFVSSWLVRLYRACFFVVLLQSLQSWFFLHTYEPRFSFLTYALDFAYDAGISSEKVHIIFPVGSVASHL